MVVSGQPTNWRLQIIDCRLQTTDLHYGGGLGRYSAVLYWQLRLLAPAGQEVVCLFEQQSETNLLYKTCSM